MDFAKELPFEHEYYRTSTDRDEFIRPSPTDENTSIEGIDDGIDLNDESFRSLIPLCNYQITLIDYNGTVDDISIEIQGLTVKNGRKKNVPLKDFTRYARKQIFDRVRHGDLTQDTQKVVNTVTTHLRHLFTRTYGYEDSCGISITLQTQTHPSNYDDSDFRDISSESYEEVSQSTPNADVVTTEASVEELSVNPVNDEKTLNKPPIDGLVVTEIQPDNIKGRDTTTIDDSVEFITEGRQIDIRKTPKLSPNIKAIIAMYKALNNWKY